MRAKFVHDVPDPAAPLRPTSSRRVVDSGGDPDTALLVLDVKTVPSSLQVTG